MTARKERAAASAGTENDGKGTYNTRILHGRKRDCQVIIDELLRIVEQSVVTERAVKGFDAAHGKDGIDLCANHWPGNQVHVYNGIEKLADEVGAKLTSIPYHNGITVERSFDYGGAHFFQLLHSEANANV